MNQLLREILSSMDTIDGWHILEQEIESSELFYIKEAVDMNRMKKVHHFAVTVYKDFEEDGHHYKGSSETKIAPTMDREEILEALQEAAYAATFVKNQYYPLVEGQGPKTVTMACQLNDKPLNDWLPEFSQAIFQANIPEEDALNSAELFLNRNTFSIYNSQGVEAVYHNHDVHLEFITNWKGTKEEVESFKNMNFADYAPQVIADEIGAMIEISKEKSEAIPTPSLSDFNVLLTGEPLKEFFSYYLSHASARSVYEEISTFKIGDNMQGQIKGDAVSITLDPALENSSFSKPFDTDGLPLKKVKVLEAGVLKQYWGGTRYAHYLDIEPTGNIRNFIVSPGSKSIETMKQAPYLELLEFSDFQMNALTGDFAGEIRLGRYFDGQQVHPVTTGSLSGNIKEVQEEMFLSQEIYQANNYKGPRTLQLLKVNIAGN